MFAVLRASAEVPLDALIEVARAFTPRFQVLGPLVLLDAGGLSALFGTAGDLGAALVAARPDCRAVALAGTASAALVLGCGREGLTVVAPGEEPAALADVPVEVLLEVMLARMSAAAPAPWVVPGTSPALPAIGWRHPRDTHQAQHTRRLCARPMPVARRRAVMALQQCGATLRRWGIGRLGALAALPRSEVHARLGELGVMWQRLAAGEDDEPLVPWLEEPVFESQRDLEWPIEGFEPLSFVLARLLEPLSARLEQADRGAVAIRTALHLTTRQVHLRVLPLPAPMRDPKALRTLVLLDLESHPPAAAIDRVQLRLEPTPGRVLQWTLFERAQPAPEQVATLVARLTALVGDGHVGSPALADSWRPGAFVMEPFRADRAIEAATSAGVPAPHAATLPLAFRRFRLPIPVRVRVDDGRPVRLTTDRRGITGGAIVQAAGPWRTSGAWWIRERVPGEALRESVEPRVGDAGDGDRTVSGGRPEPSRYGSAWDRDEWEVAMADGTVYRLSVEREVGQWALEGVFD